MLILYKDNIYWVSTWIFENACLNFAIHNFTTPPIVLFFIVGGFFLFELQMPLVPKALQEDWQE